MGEVNTQALESWARQPGVLELLALILAEPAADHNNSSPAVQLTGALLPHLMPT